MRVIIEKPADGDEDEIIVRCREPDDEIMSLIYSIAHRLFRGRHSKAFTQGDILL